jgi:FAD:protein FMN transferase
MQRRGWKRKLAAWGLFIVLGTATHITPAAEPATLRRWEFREQHMGVDVSLSIYDCGEKAANHAAQQAFARIAELNAIFSDYDPNSEAMRVCATATPGQSLPIGRDLAFILRDSQRFSVRTEGAFDITIGPLTKQWRRARRRGQLPDAADLETARQLSGWRKVTVDAESDHVTLTQTGMQWDFGGIVKGYAAEEALRVIQRQGISKALVAIAGDMAAGDPPPGQPGWRVGVAPLPGPDGDTTPAEPSTWIRIANGSVSTSGDAFQYVEIDNVRYSHIVDPRTGIGLTQPIAVTVIAPRGHAADSLATAACVLGVELGMNLIEGTPGATGLIVSGGAGQPTFHKLRRFAEYEEP